MTPLRVALDEYLALRRGLGSELVRPGAQLHHFVDFLDREGARVITADLALRWATAPSSATPTTWAQRLADVRRFASWMSATDSRTEVPSSDLLPYRLRRCSPYIYSDEEVARVVRGAERLPSRLGLRARTYASLFGLLAATGLRISEAVALDRDTVDLRAGILAVQRAKFGKSRFVPIHVSTCKALHRYARQRDRLFPRPASAAFFLSERGARISQCSSRYNFALVSRAIGLRSPTLRHRHGRGPRLHDLRHRVAVRTLVRWYREGRDVERELPKLATYLGHVHVAETYWYIEAVPELLQLATERVTAARRGAL
ncbi:MAG TPA: tyrosine-type recombinase/integrase [Anaeromyxobacteraceae bacterium]|nr:tyrosine-type recombinase/integrase [Anaeromyxobacteraceae bacterium]